MYKYTVHHMHILTNVPSDHSLDKLQHTPQKPTDQNRSAHKRVKFEMRLRTQYLREFCIQNFQQNSSRASPPSEGHIRTYQDTTINLRSNLFFNIFIRSEIRKKNNN